MPQTSLEICDACGEFAFEPVGQTSVVGIRRSTADVAMRKMLSLELGDYIAKRSVFGKIPG